MKQKQSILIIFQSMMISPNLLSLFLLINFALQNQVFSSPVLYWSNTNLPQSAVSLSTLASNRLISDYICKLTEKQIQLRLFAVNDLTIEDIQRGPEQDHPLLLKAKKDQTNFRYFPNVANDIFQALSLLPRSNNLKCSHIHFQIASSKTYQTLADALDIMQATINNLDGNTKDTVIIALVNSPSDSDKLSRKRRQTSSNGINVLISNNKTCMFYAKQLTWNNVNGTKSTGQNYTLNFVASSCQPDIITTSNSNYSSVTLNLLWTNANAPFDTIAMSLITTIIGQYWYLENATINASEYRYFAHGMNDRMVTPPSFSYVCNNAMFVRHTNLTGHGKYNFTDKFYLTDLQFQPFQGNGLVFGLPNYCTSFFTSGIWMGITTSLLCLGILLVGVHRMMTIKSNDRFDDPRGKVLMIKTHE